MLLINEIAQAEFRLVCVKCAIRILTTSNHLRTFFSFTFGWAHKNRKRLHFTSIIDTAFRYEMSRQNFISYIVCNQNKIFSYLKRA